MTFMDIEVILVAVLTVLVIIDIILRIFLLNREKFENKIKKDHEEDLERLFKETVQLQKQVTSSTEFFNNSISNSQKSLEKSANSTIDKLDDFEKRLKLIKEVTFDNTKGKGQLGEAYIRASLEIIFGKESHGTIWFEPKSCTGFLENFVNDLKALNIDPDFLLKLGPNHWIVIDSKLYLPGLEAINRIEEFEKGKKETSRNSSVRKDIDSWINRLKSETRKLIDKGYLDDVNGLYTLWIVAPDSLVYYYWQKFGTSFIINNRCMLVSFTSINWLLIEVKTLHRGEIAVSIALDNPNWLIDLEKAQSITSEIYNQYNDWFIKITEGLNSLNEIREALTTGSLETSTKKLNELIISINSQLKALRSIDYKPRIRGHNYNPK